MGVIGCEDRIRPAPSVRAPCRQPEKRRRRAGATGRRRGGSGDLPDGLGDIGDHGLDQPFVVALRHHPDHRFGAGFGLGMIMIASAAIWTELALLVF